MVFENNPLPSLFKKKKKRIIRIFSILSLIRAVNILSQATLPCAKHSDLVSHPTEKRKKKDRCLLSGIFKAEENVLSFYGRKTAHSFHTLDSC